MNRAMVIGLVGGIGIATAGGVAGLALMSHSGQLNESGSAVVDEAAMPAEAAVAGTGSAVEPTSQIQTPAAQPAPTRAAPPAPAPTAARVAPQPAAAPAPEQRCWDEEVVVQAEPRDDQAIAGTAAGALIGGALAKKLGDDNDLATAAGAAAGAFAGRRFQRQYQENNTTTVTERRCEPVQ